MSTFCMQAPEPHPLYSIDLRGDAESGKDEVSTAASVCMTGNDMLKEFEKWCEQMAFQKVIYFRKADPGFREEAIYVRIR